jgi:hypothetical protein
VLRRVACLAWLPVAVIVVLGGACSSDGGGGGNGTPDSGSPDTGAGFGSSSCGTCVAQACSNERAACLSDPGCATFMTCLEGCPVAANGNVDSSCASACPSPSSSSGQTAKTSFETCRATGAGASQCPCGGVDAGVVDSGKPPNPILDDQNCSPSTSNGCSKCFDDHCCKLQDTCLGNADCTALANCVGNCTGWACESKCYQDHPTSTVKYAQYYGCVAIFCPGDDADCEHSTNQTLNCIVINECRNAYADCYANEACYLIVSCAIECNGDVSCIDTCKTQNPDGVDLWGAMTLCWEQKCGYTA